MVKHTGEMNKPYPSAPTSTCDPIGSPGDELEWTSTIKSSEHYNNNQSNTVKATDEEQRI